MPEMIKSTSTLPESVESCAVVWQDKHVYAASFRRVSGLGLLSDSPPGPGCVDNSVGTNREGFSLDIQEKRCRKCREIKPLEAFNRKAGHKGDIAARCRECAKAYQATYREANREALREKNNAYRALHPKPRKAPQPRKPRDPLMALAKRPRSGMSLEQLEQVRAYDRARRAANIERYREYRRNYVAQRSAEIAARLKEWTHENRATRKAARVEHVSVLVLIDRDKGRCGICGLQVAPGEHSIDHILPITQGGEHSYANTQLAHLLCNQKKSNRGRAQLRMLS